MGPRAEHPPGYQARTFSRLPISWLLFVHERPVRKPNPTGGLRQKIYTSTQDTRQSMGSTQAAVCGETSLCRRPGRH